MFLHPALRVGTIAGSCGRVHGHVGRLTGLGNNAVRVHDSQEYSVIHALKADYTGHKAGKSSWNPNPSPYAQSNRLNVKLPQGGTVPLTRAGKPVIWFTTPRGTV